MPVHPPCCRTGQGAGYCERYRQFMPEPLQLVCQGTALTPAECLGQRLLWDKQGGPLALKAADIKNDGKCKFLGGWTGKVC